MKPKNKINVSIEDLCLDEIIESEKEHYTSKLEPFSVYAARQKAEFIKKNSEYAKTVQAGYDVIMDRLAKKQKK
jgi:hypothetical protein